MTTSRVPFFWNVALMPSLRVDQIGMNIQLFLDPHSFDFRNHRHDLSLMSGVGQNRSCGQTQHPVGGLNDDLTYPFFLERGVDAVPSC